MLWIHNLFSILAYLVMLNILRYYISITFIFIVQSIFESWATFSNGEILLNISLSLCLNFFSRKTIMYCDHSYFKSGFLWIYEILFPRFSLILISSLEPHRINPLLVIINHVFTNAHHTFSWLSFL